MPEPAWPGGRTMNFACGFRLSVALLALAPTALAGGALVSTVQDGNWLSDSTWDAGRPPLVGAFEQASVNHNLLIDGTVDSFETLVAGLTPGSITIDGNSFNSGSTTIGLGGGLGRIEMSAGSLSGARLTIGSSSEGLFQIRGGTLTVSQLWIGASSATGTLLIEGGAATIDATAANPVEFGADARIVVRPTANGVAGLSAIQIGSSEFGSQARLELDTSAYAPQIGDEWVVLSYNSLFLGEQFPVVVAPVGYTVEQDTSVADQLSLRVTGIPAAAVPASSGWGQAVLIGALLLAFILFATLRRGP